MGVIDDNRLKRKDQDKPLGSFGAKDKPKDADITTDGSLHQKKKDLDK